MTVRVLAIEAYCWYSPLPQRHKAHGHMPRGARRSVDCCRCMCMCRSGLHVRSTCCGHEWHGSAAHAGRQRRPGNPARATKLGRLELHSLTGGKLRARGIVTLGSGTPLLQSTLLQFSPHLPHLPWRGAVHTLLQTGNKQRLANALHAATCCPTRVLTIAIAAHVSPIKAMKKGRCPHHRSTSSTCCCKRRKQMVLPSKDEARCSRGRSIQRISSLGHTRTRTHTQAHTYSASLQVQKWGACQALAPTQCVMAPNP